jgi:translocation and assembly module TamB
MPDHIRDCFAATFKKSSARVMRRAAEQRLRASIPKTACCMRHPAYSSAPKPSTNLLAISARPIRTSFIGGSASHPKVTVTSTPEMPADQVLARMLYPNSNGSPSPLQLAAIASSLAELSGVGSGGGPLEGLSQSLGLEQLSVGTTANGSSALVAGRYVAPGVYVGAQQGAGGNSSQARVEIDIARGLKVVGTVGNGTNATPGATPAESAGTSLGLKYQFDY